MLGKILFQIHWRIREATERLCLLTHTTPIVVYTMGKVGSTSIYYSLKKKFGWRTMFAHRLLDKNIEDYNAIFLKNGMKPHRSIIGKLIYWKKIKHNKPVKFISLVREPIAKNISDFFQDFKVYNSTEYENWNGTFEDLKNNFMSNYNHKATLDWFDVECSKVMDLNIYDIPFDFKSGYQMYKNGNRELLILRSDLSEEIKSKAIAKYLDNEGINIQRYNEAAEKKYDILYKRFLKNVSLPISYIDEMLDSKYARHFFEPHQLEEIKSKWENHHPTEAQFNASE